jgi:hypothetical protein
MTMAAQPSYETIAAEIRQLHEDAPTIELEHLQWRLRELYRAITGTDPWPETRR